MLRLTDLIQSTLDGILYGSGYALLAVGFTMTFGVMRRLNLAYGPIVLAGAYLGAAAHAVLGWTILAVAPVVLIGAALTGAYIDRLCFRPFAQEAAITSMVASFAIWMQIEEAASLLLPSHTNPFPALTRAAPLMLGPFMIRLDLLAMLLVAISVGGGLAALLKWTRTGLAIRTVIESPRGAAVVGIPVAEIGSLAFILASVVGGIAGLLLAAVDGYVTPMLGMVATSKGLIAMMLGGLGSIRGAILGGLLLGVVEAHAISFGPQVRDLVAWGILFAILALQPGGLLGARIQRQGRAIERRV